MEKLNLNNSQVKNIIVRYRESLSNIFDTMNRGVNKNFMCRYEIMKDIDHRAQSYFDFDAETLDKTPVFIVQVKPSIYLWIIATVSIPFLFLYKGFTTGFNRNLISEFKQLIKDIYHKKGVVTDCYVYQFDKTKEQLYSELNTINLVSIK